MQVIMGPAWLAGTHFLISGLYHPLYTFLPAFDCPISSLDLIESHIKKCFFLQLFNILIRKCWKLELEANCLSRVLSRKTFTRYVNPIKMGETHVKTTDITHYCPNFFESPVLVFLKRCRHHWSRCWLWSKSWHWSRCWDVRTWTQHTTLCNICTWAPGMLHPSG